MSPRLLLPLLCLFAWPLCADEARQPGHSMLGEAFDEGPRQFAHLMPGATAVHFPITTKAEEAQQFFDQGVTQLHGFWYFEAERSFRQVAYLDHDCAMAYCGMALANINNEKRAAGFVQEATKRRASASPREQRWIDMWAAYFATEKKGEIPRREALVHAYENLIFDFPDDLEARVFLILQLWDNSSHGIPMPSRLAVAALGQPVLATAPMHPGVHHYLIHLWNGGGTDRQALPDAARSGQSAPAIAHLWHMSGHTYSDLRRYADAAWQQEASARVDHAYMREARILPEQIHNYAHNNDWLVKNLGYLGRVHDAMSLAKNLVELPRLDSQTQNAWRMGRAQLMRLSAEFGLWDELTALESTSYLAPDPDAAKETQRLRALGVAWYRKADAARGGEKLSALEARLETARKERYAAADAAETEAVKTSKSEEETAKAMEGALRGFAGRLRGLENAVAEVRLARAVSVGDAKTAKEQLPLAHDLSATRRAEWHLALGQHEEAMKLLQKEIKADPGQVLPYALLAQVHEKAGHPALAAKNFELLREHGPEIDLDVPVFARLAPIAARLKAPTDWRVARTPPTDVGARPPLDQLGPFRWSPYPAPPLALPDRDGQTVALGNRPTLLLFYLGSGCAGCIEQLNRFSPATKAFADAGIDLVAVSTDTPEGLKATFAQAKDGHDFGFRILSDHGLEAFHAYRAFDDFESMPLHGAFLVDASGLVRWQNISYKPFAEPDWLLGEAKRLLALPAEPAPATVARAAEWAD